MTKAEFERRAAEMKARNLENRQFRKTLPPRSVFAPPRVAVTPAKVYVRDFLTKADLDSLSPPLSCIKQMETLETNRDGLLDLSRAGLHISVSPELLVRALRVYDAVLKEALARGWQLSTDDPQHIRLLYSGEGLMPAVAEKTDPVIGIEVRPGERRPRRPSGTLIASLFPGGEKAAVSDKRGTLIESMLDELLQKAEALASEAHARNECLAEMRQREDIEQRRRRELQLRIERLDRNMTNWERAVRIRAYANAMADRLQQRGRVDPDSDAAKWLAWAQRYADSIDPTCASLEGMPQ